MPPRAAKVVKDAAPIAKEAKHKAKAVTKSEAAEKKSAKATPKGKESNSYPRPPRMVIVYISRTTQIKFLSLSLCHLTEKLNF